jgi:hypothetical protein
MPIAKKPMKMFSLLAFLELIYYSFENVAFLERSTLCNIIPIEILHRVERSRKAVFFKR